MIFLDIFISLVNVYRFAKNHFATPILTPRKRPKLLRSHFWEVLWYFWKEHITGKVKLINQKSRQMHWLLQRRSRLSNNFLPYKAINMPAWIYGIRTASFTNINRLERAENKLVLNVPFYVRNIKKDLNLPSVVKEIAKYSMSHLNKINEHVNPSAVMMLESTIQCRRLKKWQAIDLSFRVQ